MQRIVLGALTLAISSATSALAQAPAPTPAPPPPAPAYGVSLTYDQATRAMDTAEAEARKNNWNVVIAVVDAGGHLMSLRRFDNTQTASIRIAEGKARTAVAFRRPTKALEDSLQTTTRILAIEDIMPLEGGVLIVADSKIIGGIGVSGVASSQDAQIARAGADSLK